VPGLKVLAPYDAADAKGLLKAAIRDPNPVVFLEHEMLYGQEFDVPEGSTGSCRSARPRSAAKATGVTLVAYSRMVGFCLEGGREAGRRGDRGRGRGPAHHPPDGLGTVVESVKKTNRLVTVEEGWGPMGVGAEIVAKVLEHAFDYLDAPPLRVHQEDVPLPYAANLEALSMPSVEKIVKAAKQVSYK
jgi:pyruvate dehydrogenase E1 component beta subunit